MDKIEIEKLSEEITERFRKYTKDVIYKIDEISNSLSEEALERLKSTSPKRTGKYSRAWSLETIKSYGQVSERILYVKKPHYRLAHLLENGHVKRGGGRVRAVPHIKQVEDDLVNKFTKSVEEVIKNGEN